MGITGLLPFVKKACRNGNISEFSGRTVAVDVSCLLHRGMFGCMDQIATGEKTNFYIYFVRKHILSLLELKCHVIMVFDGRPLPAKKDTNDGRRARREENMMAGHALLSQGKEEQASEMFKRATHITTEVVSNTIEFFRNPKFSNVDIIVAPYEADAQLAFLTNNGMADLVITQDSDLIAFGCEKIVFKWDNNTGNCLIYEKELLPSCFSKQFNFSFERFRRVCILSGCDYLQAGLPGVGLAKALQFFTKTSQTDLRVLLRRIPGYLQMPKLRVSQEFIEDYIMAENTFLYQVVFDPRSRSQRPLNPYPKEEKENKDELDADGIPEKENSPLTYLQYSFAGEILTVKNATRLALGNKIDCGVLEDKFLLPNPIPSWSVWSDSFETGGACIERRSAEIKEKETKCGAFKFDSSSKRRKRGIDATSDDDVAVIESPSQANGMKRPLPQRGGSLASFFRENPGPAPKAKSRPAISTSRIKNEADHSWSVDEMMKMFESEPSDDSPTSHGRSSQQSSSQYPSNSQSSLASLSQKSLDSGFKTDDDEQKERSSLKDRKRSRIESISMENDEIQLIEDMPSPIVGEPESPFASRPSPSVPIMATSTPHRAPLRSGYFVGRSKSCMNPFKKPRFLGEAHTPTGAPSPTRPLSPNVLDTAQLDSPKNSSFNGSFLSRLEISEEKKAVKCSDEEGGQAAKITAESTEFKMQNSFTAKFGFRPAGLRRSISSSKS